MTHITDDMVDAALLGAMTYDTRHDAPGGAPKGDDYFRGQMRAALEAALRQVEPREETQ